MGAALRFIYANTYEAIEDLEPTDAGWIDQAFYYPDDATWFYQARNGVMRKFHGDPAENGVGVKLNGKVIGGVKELIEEDDVLTIPVNWAYNTYRLQVNGSIECYGTITIP